MTTLDFLKSLLFGVSMGLLGYYYAASKTVSPIDDNNENEDDSKNDSKNDSEYDSEYEINDSDDSDDSDDSEDDSEDDSDENEISKNEKNIDIEKISLIVSNRNFNLITDNKMRDEIELNNVNKKDALIIRMLIIMRDIDRITYLLKNHPHRFNINALYADCDDEYSEASNFVLVQLIETDPDILSDEIIYTLMPYLSIYNCNLLMLAFKTVNYSYQSKILEKYIELCEGEIKSKNLNF